VIDLAKFLSGHLVRRDGSPKRHCIVDLPRLPDSGPSDGVRWQLQLSTDAPRTVRVRMLAGGRKPGTKATPAVRFDFPPKSPAEVHAMLLREGVEIGPLEE
jgi:hypothetical protein